MTIKHPNAQDIPQPLRWFDYTTGAEYLGISKRALERIQHSGKIGYTRLGNLRVRFSQSQLDAYVQSVTVTPAN